MAKTQQGLERGDILVSLGTAYIYADPEDSKLDLEVEKANAGQRFGVATGVTKQPSDGFAYTEMVFYVSGDYDLDSTKYYVLQSTYSVEENPDYDYSQNKKTTVGTVTKGIGDGFTKFVDLISGIFGLIPQKNAAKDSSDESDSGSGSENNDNNGDKGNGTNESWFQRNKFALILGAIGIGIVSVVLYVSGKNKKKDIQPPTV